MTKQDFKDRIRYGKSRQELIEWFKNDWDGFMPLDLIADMAKELAGRSDDEHINESDAMKMTNEFLAKDPKDHLEDLSTDTLARCYDRISGPRQTFTK